MELLGPLKRHFGHDQFRPLQQEIVQDALAGQDVFVLMPTGGGKSLCFQLPALMRDGLTIVVSPLIALMKDQVDALEASGIAATYLNSTLNREEAKTRWRGLHRGQCRRRFHAGDVVGDLKVRRKFRSCHNSKLKTQNYFFCLIRSSTNGGTSPAIVAPRWKTSLTRRELTYE